MSDQGTVRAFGFDLDRLPEQERAEAWRRTVGQGFAVHDLPQTLSGRAKAWDLGQAILTDVTHPRQTFVRDGGLARRDGEEHVRVSVELTQPSLLALGDREVATAPRQVHLFDMARPMTKVVGAGRVLCLAVSREALEAVLPGADLHGVTLGSTGTLVSEHLRVLGQTLEAGTSVAPGPAITATLHLIAACLAPTAGRIDAARPALSEALLHRARRYIRARCADGRLSPDEVARALGASRAALYRAFEPEGGVADYIRRSRLEAARAALANPSEARRIGEIAFAVGFGSEAQFSRAFRAEFGAAPSEFRQRPEPATVSGRLDSYWANAGRAA